MKAAERTWAYVVVMGAALAVAWPAFGPLEADSFPLSTYPMFAKLRGKPRMHQLVGVDARGEETVLGPEYVGTSEVLQAKTLIDKAARSRSRRKKLCRQVASRPQTAPFARVELRQVRFDAVDYFVSGPEPIQSKTLTSCKVKHD